MSQFYKFGLKPPREDVSSSKFTDRRYYCHFKLKKKPMLNINLKWMCWLSKLYFYIEFESHFEAGVNKHRVTVKNRSLF